MNSALICDDLKTYDDFHRFSRGHILCNDLNFGLNLLGRKMKINSKSEVVLVFIDTDVLIGQSS